MDNDGIKEEQMILEGHIREAEASIKTLEQFHNEVTKYWSEENRHIIDHIAYSPAITVGIGTKRYTEDWAFIELDRKKIDSVTFRGNVIIGMYRDSNFRYLNLCRRCTPAGGVVHWNGRVDREVVKGDLKAVCIACGRRWNSECRRAEARRKKRDHSALSHNICHPCAHSVSMPSHTTSVKLNFYNPRPVYESGIFSK